MMFSSLYGEGEGKGGGEGEREANFKYLKPFNSRKVLDHCNSSQKSIFLVIDLYVLWQLYKERLFGNNI